MRCKISSQQTSTGNKGRFPGKKAAALLGFVQITSPKFGQVVQLQNYSLSKIIQRQNTCFVGHVYNLENSQRFKLLAFWRKWTPFIDQKCTYEKAPKNSGRALPPPHLDRIQKNSYFFGKPSLSQRPGTKHKKAISDAKYQINILPGRHIQDVFGDN